MVSGHAAFHLSEIYALGIAETVVDFAISLYASSYVAPQSHSYTIGCFATRDTRTRSQSRHGHNCLVVVLASLHTAPHAPTPHRRGRFPASYTKDIL
jgi:hypothetical protein